MNRNHLSMANIFKIQEYQTFGLMKIRNSIYEKVWFTINEPTEMLFLFFASFIFPNLKWQLPKIIGKKHLFYDGFWRFLWSSTTSQTFLFNKFLTMQRWLFWSLHGVVFCSFIFSKWKEYYNLTFEDTFKMYFCALC